MESSAKANQNIENVPIMYGPQDGGIDDAVIADGELCGKIYFSPFTPNHCHTYNLIFNLDDGFKFVYCGLKPFSVQPDGSYTVGE